MRHMFLLIGCAAALVAGETLVAGPARAETITTEAGHFRIHYSPETQETAREVGIVAEGMFYQLVTAFNVHERFQPIDILVTDDIDVGNGYADYYQNQIAIWAANLDWQLRGTHEWVRNVISHELAHVFSLKVARRYPFRYGIISANVLNSSVADFGVSIPIYSLVTPSWWVEGIAQYESGLARGDAWDSHRDMLLRMATLEDDLLSYDDMGVFAHDWLHSEMVYNQGYGLCRYIARRFGPDKPRELAARTGYVTFNSATNQVLGLSGSQLYRAWTDDLRSHYRAVRDSVGAVVEGTKLADDGSFEWSPAISPDGTRLAYVSAGREDFLLTKPYIRYLGSDHVRTLDEEVFGRVAWFPGGDKVAYTKFGRGTGYLDLFDYDLASGRERRITSQMRTRDPAVSPDGQWIAFVSTEDGANRLGMARADGSEIRWLTNDRRSEAEGASPGSKTSTFVQIYAPQWSPDGTRLLFSIFKDGDRDIAAMSTAGPYFSLRDALSDSAAFPDTLVYPDASGFRVLVDTRGDERDPAWLPDGSGFVYAADYGGIFNLYRCSLPPAGDSSAAPRIEKLANVLGGAFCPDVAPDGTWLAYVGYHAGTFGVYSLPLGEAPTAAGGVQAMVQLSTRTDRDYQHIDKEPSAKELFHVGPTRASRKIVGWVPTIRFGPNFIGDRFTVNHVGAGLALAVEDQMSGRFYYGEAEATKNLERKDPPSTSIFLYVEQALRPVLASESGLAPSLYVYGSRAQLGVSNDETDRLEWPLPTEIEGPGGERIPVSLSSSIVVTDSMTVWDNYHYLLGGLGFRVAHGRHSLAAELSWRRFRLEDLIDRRLTNVSKLYDARTPDVEVTHYFPWEQLGFPVPGGSPLTIDQRPQFDMRYYDDRTLAFVWSYGRLTPTVDEAINPTGGRVFSVAYQFHSVAVADSLGLAGLDTDGDGRPDSWDPNAPAYRGVPRNMTINEVILRYGEYIRLPGFLRRTTLVLDGLIGFMDRPLKAYVPSDRTRNYLEGWAYWPLRYRLGGGGTLRGYPYFSSEGSKMALFRASYVFPVIRHRGLELLNVYHASTYGALFIEAGSTWNWQRLSQARIYRDDWLWDVGAELRLAGFSFYQIPIAGYAAVARRMTDVPPPAVRQPDRVRVYFGFSLGFGGGASGGRNRRYVGGVRRPDAPLAPRDGIGDAPVAPLGGMPYPASGTPPIASAPIEPAPQAGHAMPAAE